MWYGSNRARGRDDFVRIMCVCGCVYMCKRIIRSLNTWHTVNLLYWWFRSLCNLQLYATYVLQCMYSMCTVWCVLDRSSRQCVVVLCAVTSLAHVHMMTQGVCVCFWMLDCVCVCVLASVHVHVMTQGVGVSQLVTSFVAVLTSPHHFQSLYPLPFVLQRGAVSSSLSTLS